MVVVVVVEEPPSAGGSVVVVVDESGAVSVVPPSVVVVVEDEPSSVVVVVVEVPVSVDSLAGGVVVVVFCSQPAKANASGKAATKSFLNTMSASKRQSAPRYAARSMKMAPTRTARGPVVACEGRA